MWRLIKLVVTVAAWVWALNLGVTSYVSIEGVVLLALVLSMTTYRDVYADVIRAFALYLRSNTIYAFGVWLHSDFDGWTLKKTCDEISKL